MGRDFELVCLVCMKKLPIGSRETWIADNAEAIAAFYDAHKNHKTAALADGMWLDKQAVLQEIRFNRSARQNNKRQNGRQGGDSNGRQEGGVQNQDGEERKV